MPTNSIELSQDETVLCEAARAAWGSLRKTFDHWLAIGKAITALRAKANEIGGRQTFKRLLAQQRLDVLNSGTISLLEKIVANVKEVTAWHSRLEPHLQIKYASPSAINKHCPVLPKSPRSPRAPGASSRGQGPTIANPQSIPTLTREIDRLEARVLELEEELTSSRATHADAPDVTSDVVQTSPSLEAARVAYVEAIKREVGSDIKAIKGEQTAYMALVMSWLKSLPQEAIGNMPKRKQRKAKASKQSGGMFFKIPL